MKIFIEKEQKNIEKKFNGTVLKLLTDLNINPETVLLIKNNELLEEKDNLTDSDSIKILSVVSGG